MQSWNRRGPWGILKGISVREWKTIALYGAERESAKIDTVVTTDVHRLIRLTNTLHGKTGLRKVRVPSNKIEDFDPWKNAIAFNSGTVKVHVLEAPQFRIGDESYGPYRDENIELPTAAAMLLLCKGLAWVEEE